MAKISSLTRWGGVRMNLLLYLEMKPAQHYVQIHNTIYSVQFAFHVLTHRTSAKGKGEVRPRTGYEGLEGGSRDIALLYL